MKFTTKNNITIIFSHVKLLCEQDCSAVIGETSINPIMGIAEYEEFKAKYLEWLDRDARFKEDVCFLIKEMSKPWGVVKVREIK